MATFAISIPDELKQRMDQVDANWEQVAVDAFEFMVKRLANAEKRFAKSTIDQATERLRFSKQLWCRLQDNMIDSIGDEAGRKWALESASYEQLRNLAGSAVELTGKPPSAEAVVYYISYHPDYPEDYEPNYSLGPNTVREFWEAHAGSYHTIALANGDRGVDDEALGEAFRLAFVEGALQVWSEVASKL